MIILLQREKRGWVYVNNERKLKFINSTMMMILSNENQKGMESEANSGQFFIQDDMALRGTTFYFGILVRNPYAGPWHRTTMDFGLLVRNLTSQNHT
jgi:hypothetical protein